MKFEEFQAWCDETGLMDTCKGFPERCKACYEKSKAKEEDPSKDVKHELKTIGQLKQMERDGKVIVHIVNEEESEER